MRSTGSTHTTHGTSGTKVSDTTSPDGTVVQVFDVAHSATLQYKNVYLEILYSCSSSIYHVENGVLVPYEIYHAENGRLVSYQLFKAENNTLVQY